MLPWGLLAGLIITLLFLAQMRRTQVDWAQWSLIGTSALYALELLRAGRAPAVSSEPRPQPALSR
jgi:hypothetical protein